MFRKLLKCFECRYYVSEHTSRASGPAVSLCSPHMCALDCEGNFLMNIQLFRFIALISLQLGDLLARRGNERLSFVMLEDLMLWLMFVDCEFWDKRKHKKNIKNSLKLIKNLILRTIPEMCNSRRCFSHLDDQMLTTTQHPWKTITIRLLNLDNLSIPIISVLRATNDHSLMLNYSRKSRAEINRFGKGFCFVSQSQVYNFSLFIMLQLNNRLRCFLSRLEREKQ